MSSASLFCITTFFSEETFFLSGEISNLKINSFSGHMYFTLKDDQAAVKAVMFKWAASRIKFLPQDGMKVICRCDVTMYEKDGVYQINVGDMQPDGAGSIAIAFEQLKAKLEAEGLFDVSKKQHLPQFPKKIAVITSDTGAAVRDMISINSASKKLAKHLCTLQIAKIFSFPSLQHALLLLLQMVQCEMQHQFWTHACHAVML